MIWRARISASTLADRSDCPLHAYLQSERGENNVLGDDDEIYVHEGVLVGGSNERILQNCDLAGRIMALTSHKTSGYQVSVVSQCCLSPSMPS